MSDKRVYEIPTSVMEKDGAQVTVKDAKARRMLNSKPDIDDTTPSATSVYSSEKTEERISYEVAAAVADFVSFTEDQTSRTDAEKAQARDNIGVYGKWTKVWENASPSSNFSSQTLSLGLTDYSCIIVEFNYLTNNTAGDSVICYKGGQALSVYVYDGKLHHRRAEFRSNGDVYFSSGFKTNSYGSNADTPGCMIPTRIWAM